MTLHIKSKKRVSDYGEVFTGEREVNAMIELVRTESMRIDSRMLEPAVGNGNFLTAILERKLNAVKRIYKKTQSEYERYAFLAVSRIYGIDILEDNVEECRDRLYKLIKKQYIKLYKESASEEFLNSIKYLLAKNIICGDSLTGLKNGENQESIIA